MVTDPSFPANKYSYGERQKNIKPKQTLRNVLVCRQNLPNPQKEPQNKPESKDEMANESDIEFVETGPQVIEIPDANDSR